MSQFKQRNEKYRATDSWVGNYDEQMNEKSIHANQLKTFTPVNTLLKKQDGGSIPPIHPTMLKKDSMEHPPVLNNRPLLQLNTKDSEVLQLNIQGQPQTPNMINSNNQGIQRSTTIHQQNSALYEQSFTYLKTIEEKNQNKYFSMREELDIFKHLSLVYNVNTIVNSNFQSCMKHNTIEQNVYNASVDSLKLQNKLPLHKLQPQTVINPQPQVKQEKIQKPYKNILSTLYYDTKPETQLLVVELVNMGQNNNQFNQIDKNGIITNSGAANIYNSVQNTNGLTHSQRTVDANTFFSNYKAFPTLYQLNFESPREPCPYIAIDRVQGRHFIYNNDDKIMVFSNEPISNPLNDKSKPLLQMSLDDKLDDYMAQKANGGIPDIGESQQNPLVSQQLGIIGRARINPTLQIINDYKGNSALLVIGGYIDLGNGQYQPKQNIKVFGIGKRKIDIKPVFQINMKQPRVNPIVMRVKQSHCKHAQASQTEDKKYLLLLGGATSVVDKKQIVNTNTCCSVIEYENIFKQLERHDSTQLEIQQTLKVSYNDQNTNKNLERISQFLSKGVFIHQKNKMNLDIHNKMFVVTEKKKQILHIHSISLQDNFVNIYDADLEVVVKSDIQWCYSNMCIIDNFIGYITNSNYIPQVIDTNSRLVKPLNTEDYVEFNNKRKKEDPKNTIKNKTPCSCRIF